MLTKDGPLCMKVEKSKTQPTLGHERVLARVCVVYFPEPYDLPS